MRATHNDMARVSTRHRMVTHPLHMRQRVAATRAWVSIQTNQASPDKTPSNSEMEAILKMKLTLRKKDIKL